MLSKYMVVCLGVVFFHTPVFMCGVCCFNPLLAVFLHVTTIETASVQRSSATAHDPYALWNILPEVRSVAIVVKFDCLCFGTLLDGFILHGTV